MDKLVDTDTDLDALIAEQRKTDLEIKRLAGLAVIDYEKIRKESAEALGVRASILDKLVKAQREENAAKKAEGRASAIPNRTRARLILRNY